VKLIDRRLYPQPKDRVDGPGGRRIVVARSRAYVFVNRKSGVLEVVPGTITWRRPWSKKMRRCRLQTWVRWAKRAC